MTRIRWTVQGQRDIIRTMANGYTKLFGSIIHSTIWREPAHVRLVWITMLAIADSHGDVACSVPGLADASRVELDQTLSALKLLSEPDEYSGDPDNEGRRIVKIDGGWHLLNYGKYKRKMSIDERLERDRVRKRESRLSVSCPQSHNLSAISHTRQDKTIQNKINHSDQVGEPTVVERLFGFWKKECGHPQAKLGAKRKACITKALKTYTAHQLGQAIRGCAKNPHNNGSEGGSKYDDVTLIFRDESHIDRFIEELENPPARRHVPGKKPPTKPARMAKAGDR